MDDGLTVTAYAEGAWTVVHVGGELDLFSGPRLREQLAELTRAGHHRLLVDLDAVTFLDSCGLAALLGVRAALHDLDGQLRVVCTSDRVLKVFRLTGLTEPLVPYASITAATTAPIEDAPIEDAPIEDAPGDDHGDPAPAAMN